MTAFKKTLPLILLAILAVLWSATQTTAQPQKQPPMPALWPCPSEPLPPPGMPAGPDRPLPSGPCGCPKCLERQIGHCFNPAFAALIAVNEIARIGNDHPDLAIKALVSIREKTEVQGVRNAASFILKDLYLKTGQADKAADLMAEMVLQNAQLWKTEEEKNGR